MSEGGYVYVGEAEVKGKYNKIKIPPELWEKYDILDFDEGVYWAFEKETGDLAVTNTPVTKRGEQGPTSENWVSIEGTHAPYSIEKGNYRARIPSQFWEGNESPESFEIPKEAVVHDGQRRHFIFYTGSQWVDPMHEGDVRSCFLWTDDRLLGNLDGPQDIYENDSPLPKFL